MGPPAKLNVKRSKPQLIGLRVIGSNSVSSARWWLVYAMSPYAMCTVCRSGYLLGVILAIRSNENTSKADINDERVAKRNVNNSGIIIDAKKVKTE